MHNSRSISYSWCISDPEFRVRDCVWREQPAGHDRGATLLPRGEAQQHPAQPRAPARHVVQVSGELDHSHFLWWWQMNCKFEMQEPLAFRVISNYSVWIYWPGIWQRGRWILIPSFHALCGREVIFLICLNKLSISRQFVKSLTDKGLGISRSLPLSVLPRGQQKMFSCDDHRHSPQRFIIFLLQSDPAINCSAPQCGRGGRRG